MFWWMIRVSGEARETVSCDDYLRKKAPTFPMAAENRQLQVLKKTRPSSQAS